MSQNKKKLAIVFPGGGTRGIISLKLLNELNNRVQKLAIEQNKDFTPIESLVDYLGGTSIGSIIVSAIANGYTADDITNIFTNNADKILKKSSWLSLNQPYYTNQNLIRILDEIIGKKTMGEIDKKILITSYNLEHSEKTIFSNLGCEDIRSKTHGYAWGSSDIKLIDVILASTAIPFILQSREIQYARDNNGIKTYHEIDGAMQNNSSVLDLVLAIHQLEKIDLKDIIIISVGSGSLNKNAIQDIQDQGLVGLINTKLVTVAHLCAVQRSIENCTKLLVEGCGGKFFRLEPKLSVDEYCKGINDSITVFDQYIGNTNDYIGQNDEYLDQIALEIVEHFL